MTANRMRSVGDPGMSLRGGATGSLCVCCVAMGVSGVKGLAGMKERGGVFCSGAEGTLTGRVGVFERRSARSACAERVGTASCNVLDISGSAGDEGTSTALAVSRKSSGVAEEAGLGECAGGTAPSRVLAEEDVILSGVGREGTVERCGAVFL